MAFKVTGHIGQTEGVIYGILMGRDRSFRCITFFVSYLGPLLKLVSTMRGDINSG